MALSLLELVIFLLVIALALLDIDFDLVPRPPFVIELLVDAVELDRLVLRVRADLVVRALLVDVDFVLLVGVLLLTALVDMLLPYAIIFFLLVINIYINHFLLSCSLSHLIPARRGL